MTGIKKTDLLIVLEVCMCHTDFRWGCGGKPSLPSLVLQILLYMFQHSFDFLVHLPYASKIDFAVNNGIVYPCKHPL